MKKAMICLSLVLLLAGCTVFSEKEKDTLVCPATGLIADADSIAVPADAAALMTPGNITVNAIFGHYRGACKINRKGGIDYALEIDVMASRTSIQPALKTQQLPYFIAVLDSQENILQREAFLSNLVFDDTGKAMNTDKHTVHVPVVDPATASTYQIVMGFILTPAQLDYNRETAASLKTESAGQKHVP